MNLIIDSNLENNIISHKMNAMFDLVDYENKIKSNKSPILDIREEIELLHLLSEFELGRFLLANQGLNGFWTSYLILHGPQKSNLTSLESWIVNNAPTVKATQQRFEIFKRQVKKYVRDNMSLASIPCGVMDELFTIDYENISGLDFTGIDIDNDSLILAKRNAELRGIKNCKFLRKNAWSMGLIEEFNIITSNGLNIYEHDESKVIGLYRQLNTALKPNGILITSFLTPPPSLSDTSPWRNYSLLDVKKQKAIFVDIIQAQWHALYSHVQSSKQLEVAGFDVLDIIEDEQGMFPTVVARKL